MRQHDDGGTPYGEQTMNPSRTFRHFKSSVFTVFVAALALAPLGACGGGDAASTSPDPSAPEAPGDVGHDSDVDGGAATKDAGSGEEASKPGSDAGADAPAGPTASAPIEIAAGSYHTCALFANHAVKCWGANVSAALGLGDDKDRGVGAGQMGSSLPIVDLGPGRTAKALAAGDAHTCAILDDDTVRCWGQGLYGQLGSGTTAYRGDAPNQMGANLPKLDLGPGRTAKAIAAGQAHTCAILDDGTVKCWGENSKGQLGDGDTVRRGDDAGEMGASLPRVDLGAGRTARAIALGSDHTCALLDDDTLHCWGNNYYGELGLGDSSNRGDAAGEMGANLPAVDLGPGRKAKQITAGSQYTCAVLDDASVKCWGYVGNGQLGLGNVANRGRLPGEMGANLPAVNLGAGRTAKVVRASLFNTCAILDDNTAKCWGLDWYGALGLGDNPTISNLYDRGDGPGEMGDNLPALDLGPGRKVLAISVGSERACVILDDASIRCWGHNTHGALGLGDANNRGDGPGEMGAALPPVVLW